MNDLSSKFSHLSASRREVLKTTSKALGGLATLNAIAFGLYGCSEKKDPGKVSKTEVEPSKAPSSLAEFSADDMQALDILSEQIIPATDTPGASAAGVNKYIAAYSREVANEWEQNAIKNTLEHFASFAANKNKKLSEVSPTETFAELERLDRSANGVAEGLATDFNYFKGLVIAGYYTSKIGASQELQFNAIPGGYRPIKLSEVGSAWANPV